MKHRVLIQQACQRVKRTQSKAKYPVFYDIKPLLTWAFESNKSPQEYDKETLLDMVLMQLRLTTMMRTVDAANLVWALWHQDEQYYVKTTTKTGECIAHNVTGRTLTCLLEYMCRHIDHPAMFMFRYIKDPGQCLGSERLAKRLLQRMETLGVNTEIWKAHSLRGATATHLMAKGVPQSMVQARGNWTSTATLDKYYNRLHQQQDWSELLTCNTSKLEKIRLGVKEQETPPMGGNAPVRQTATCAEPSLPSSLPETTKEVGRGEGGRGGTAQAAVCLWGGVPSPLAFRA